MVFFLILGVVLGGFTVIFAMDNAQIVTVNILSWHLTAPLSLVLIGTLVAGIVLALLAMVPEAAREALDRYYARREKRRVDAAEARLAAQNAIA